MGAEWRVWEFEYELIKRFYYILEGEESIKGFWEGKVPFLPLRGARGYIATGGGLFNVNNGHSEH
eukprot:1096920-Amorphochlora_amoeboformis.AAC.1